MASPSRLSVVAGLAAAVAPLRLASELRLAVPGALGAALPNGGVQRGSAVTVGGPAGGGATSAALHLAAAATAAGEWAAVLDPGSLGGVAAAEAGVQLERCAVVRSVPAAQWPVVVGALLDGVTVVIAPVPPRLALGDARRLLARARERHGVLVLLESVPGGGRVGVWPAEAALRLTVSASAWGRPGVDDTVLGSRSWSVQVEGNGMVRTVPVAVARAG